MVRIDEHTGEDWGEMAKIYKKLTAGTSFKPIGTMLERLNALVPFSEATGIHDNGSGPGPIMSRIIRDYGSQLSASCTLSASDFAKGMIEQVKQTRAQEVEKEAKSPWKRVEATVQDAMNLIEIGDSSMSHVTAGWVFFATPDPQQCLKESKRILKNGGVLGCSSWARSDWMDIMRLSSQVREDRKVAEIPKEWESAGAMRQELEKAGFRDVTCEDVEVTMTFDRYEALVDLIMTKMPHMMHLLKDFSEEETQKLRRAMLEKAKEMAPNEPGVLHGTALVGVGRA